MKYDKLISGSNRFDCRSTDTWITDSDKTNINVDFCVWKEIKSKMKIRGDGMNLIIEITRNKYLKVLNFFSSSRFLAVKWPWRWNTLNDLFPLWIWLFLLGFLFGFCFSVLPANSPKSPSAAKTQKHTRLNEDFWLCSFSSQVDLHLQSHVFMFLQVWRSLWNSSEIFQDQIIQTRNQLKLRTQTMNPPPPSL